MDSVSCKGLLKANSSPKKREVNTYIYFETLICLLSKYVRLYIGSFTSKGTFEMLFRVCMSKLKQYDRKTQEPKG